jgi:thiol-disulfide isomerase/thioredoxin
MKKIFAFLLLFLIITPLFSLAAPNVVREDRVEINYFYKVGCHFCVQEKVFLDEMEKKYPDLIINRFDVYQESKLLKEFYIEYNVPNEYWGATPITFTDEDYFLGFNEETTGVRIENCIINCLDNLGSDQTTCLDCVSEVAEQNTGERDLKKDFKIPFIGKIDITTYSPLLLSIVVGALDGFNACAMVALGFLLAVLVATKARKRVFLIGGTFILVSGIVYFIFISTWLNIFMFLGYLKIISLIVSVVIILFALFLLKDYYTGVICKICEVDPNKTSIFTKMQKKLFVKMSNLSTAEMSLGATLLGVAVVAAGINMVELVCSLGFPLAYTKVLTSYNLSTWQYYFYLLVYVTFYMIDDFIIFTIAVITMRITKVSDKYLKAVKLISGIILLILGLLMLFRPDLLSF